ncbi:hypothetical protein [uncultured Bacteroides sp.]|uniref:hypothetical protein n=1 Tax=uncultured Bacteroides sp. TaxID=162156 RepID=UPI002AAB2F90|nr:hypothetical protein [uncultured Bacteroides sp.]
MLTSSTKKVIALLHEMYYRHEELKANLFDYSDSSIQEMLNCLKQSGLICLRADGKDSSLSSYELSKPLFQITLLDLLMATGEGILPVFQNKESIYENYGTAACRLGVLNEVTCEMLGKIHITDI